MVNAGVEWPSRSDTERDAGLQTGRLGGVGVSKSMQGDLGRVVRATVRVKHWEWSGA